MLILHWKQVILCEKLSNGTQYCDKTISIVTQVNHGLYKVASHAVITRCNHSLPPFLYVLCDFVM